MEELLYGIMVAILYMIYVILILLVMLIVTPFVFLWPGKTKPDGKREKRNIRGRYKKIWKIWESIGLGLPTP